MAPMGQIQEHARICHESHWSFARGRSTELQLAFASLQNVSLHSDIKEINVNSLQRQRQLSEGTCLQFLQLTATALPRVCFHANIADAAFNDRFSQQRQQIHGKIRT